MRIINKEGTKTINYSKANCVYVVKSYAEKPYYEVKADYDNDIYIIAEFDTLEEAKTFMKKMAYAQADGVYIYEVQEGR